MDQITRDTHGYILDAFEELEALEEKKGEILDNNELIAFMQNFATPLRIGSRFTQIIAEYIRNHAFKTPGVKNFIDTHWQNIPDEQLIYAFIKKYKYRLFKGVLFGACYYLR